MSKSKNSNLLDIDMLVGSEEEPCPNCGEVEFHLNDENIPCCNSCDSPMTTTAFSKKKKKEVKKLREKNAK